MLDIILSIILILIILSIIAVRTMGIQSVEGPKQTVTASVLVSVDPVNIITGAQAYSSKISEKFVERFMKNTLGYKPSGILGIMITFFLTIIGWVVFRS